MVFHGTEKNRCTQVCVNVVLIHLCTALLHGLCRKWSGIDNNNHTQFELLFHFVCNVFCVSFMQICKRWQAGHCSFGSRCNFAHGIENLRPRDSKHGQSPAAPKSTSSPVQCPTQQHPPAASYASWYWPSPSSSASAQTLPYSASCDQLSRSSSSSSMSCSTPSDDGFAVEMHTSAQHLPAAAAAPPPPPPPPLPAQMSQQAAPNNFSLFSSDGGVPPSDPLNRQPPSTPPVPPPQPEHNTMSSPRSVDDVRKMLPESATPEPWQMPRIA